MASYADEYFDDFTEGREFKSGGMTLSETQILDFALAWDPQPFHIDVPAAEAGPFKGLISSGFHTLVAAFRLMHATGYLDQASMGSPGIDELRWLLPVRPNDTLRVVGKVIEQRPSGSKPDRGTARILYTVFNQDDAPVMTFYCLHILRKNKNS